VPETDSYPADTVSTGTAYGPVTSLVPPLTFTNLTLPTADRLVPYGADPASWPSERAELVKREPGPSDRRAVLATLTADGDDSPGR